MTVFDRLGAEPVAEWDPEAALNRVLDAVVNLDEVEVALSGGSYVAVVVRRAILGLSDEAE